MSTHTHSTDSTRNLPFGGVRLHICSCGARKKSDNTPIADGLLDTDGWYVKRPTDDMQEAYALLQNEGHPIKHRDTADPLDSHMPNID